MLSLSWNRELNPMFTRQKWKKLIGVFIAWQTNNLTLEPVNIYMYNAPLPVGNTKGLFTWR